MTEPTAFPQTLYVEIRQTDVDPDPWFSASESVSDLAEVDKKIRVGVYKLVELTEVEFQVVSTRVEG